jgi:hypothetical protein
MLMFEVIDLEGFISFVYFVVVAFRDDGSCKHRVALLFALHDFCERHQDLGTEACTMQMGSTKAGIKSCYNTKYRLW